MRFRSVESGSPLTAFVQKKNGPLRKLGGSFFYDAGTEFQGMTNCMYVIFLPSFRNMSS